LSKIFTRGELEETLNGEFAVRAVKMIIERALNYVEKILVEDTSAVCRE
jgi:hypothetical protein